ncbi:hypothetical protein LINPERPRIM_LOCUS9274 [Linum perenne]
MLDWNWMIEVEHIYRASNRPADYLTGLGHRLPLGDVSNLLLSLYTLYDVLSFWYLV